MARTSFEMFLFGFFLDFFLALRAWATLLRSFHCFALSDPEKKPKKLLSLGPSPRRFFLGLCPRCQKQPCFHPRHLRQPGHSTAIFWHNPWGWAHFLSIPIAKHCSFYVRYLHNTAMVDFVSPTRLSQGWAHRDCNSTARLTVL